MVNQYGAIKKELTLKKIGPCKREAHSVIIRFKSFLIYTYTWTRILGNLIQSYPMTNTSNNIPEICHLYTYKYINLPIHIP